MNTSEISTPPMEGTNFKVYIRCRPCSTLEKKVNEIVVTVNKQKSEISTKLVEDGSMSKVSFQFHGVFDMDAKQEQIYQDVAYPLIESAFEGYNGTLVAYGQSSSGKSYTIEGHDFSTTTKGIIPRSVAAIYTIADAVPSGIALVIQMSFVYLINEDIIDLLYRGKTLRKLKVKETEQGTIIEGAQYVPIKNPEEFTTYYDLGKNNRNEIEAQLDPNQRTCSILTFTIETCNLNPDGLGVIKSSKLQFLDLPCSDKQQVERSSVISLSSERQSNLFSFANVISNLADQNAKIISSKDSTIAKLLSEAFGGNSKTALIGHISPLSKDSSETISTLKVLSKLMKLQNEPIINKNPAYSALNGIKEELSELKSQFNKNIQKLEGVISNKGIFKSRNNMSPILMESPSNILRFESTREESMIAPNNSNNSKLNMTSLNDTQQLMQQGKPKPIKLCLDKEIHLLLKPPVNYKSLIDSIKSMFKNLPNYFNLQYEDSEGDKITISTDEDYRNFLEGEYIYAVKSVKIFILPFVKDKSFMDDLAITAIPSNARKGISIFDAESESGFPMIDDEMQKSGRGRKLTDDESEDNYMSMSSKEGSKRIIFDDDKHDKSDRHVRSVKDNHLSVKSNKTKPIGEIFQENFSMHRHTKSARIGRKMSDSEEILIREMSPKLSHIIKNYQRTNEDGKDVTLKGSGALFKENLTPKGGNRTLPNPLPTISSEASVRPTLSQKLDDSGEEEDAANLLKLQSPEEIEEERESGDIQPKESESPQIPRIERKESALQFDPKNIPQYNSTLARELSTSPVIIPLTPVTIYKIISLQNNGILPWPKGCYVEPCGPIKGKIVKLGELQPKREMFVTLAIESPCRIGNFSSTWRILFEDDRSGEKINIGEPFEVNFKIEKPRSCSMKTSNDPFSGDVITKAKKMKNAFPHVKFETLMNFVSKQDPEMSIEDLIQSFEDH